MVRALCRTEGSISPRIRCAQGQHNAAGTQPPCSAAALHPLSRAVASRKAFRRATQPRGRTAGSTFKAADRPAGWYLDRAGLKGERVGGAFVSGLHANFIINDGTASAADVVALIRVMKERVYAEFGVALEEEIVYLGE